MSLTVQLSQSLGALDRLLSQHAVMLSLVVAYLSFCFRLYCSASSGMSVLEPSMMMEVAVGVDALSHDDFPLTRAAVLSHSRRSAAGNSGGSSMKRAGAPTMRKASSCDVCSAEKEEPESLAATAEQKLITQWEASLQQAAAMQNPAVRGQLMGDIYASLGLAYSAQGRYHQALHSMALSLQMASDSADTSAVVTHHLSFGHLELQHYRYYAASTRFEDAIAGLQGWHPNSLLAAHAGIAWAEIMQGKFKQATSRLKSLSWSTLSCSPRGDGFDSDRALALIGTLVAAVGSEQPAATQSAMSTLQCAQQLLTASTGPRWTVARTALCMAHYAVGEAELAQRCSASSRGAAARLQDPMTLVAERLLQQSLMDFGAARNSSGSHSAVEAWLETHRGTASHEEALEWVARFAQGHSWLKGGVQLRDFLLGLAARHSALLGV
mmetsp:Transcript_66043/g.157928  ORF Transcript_66043/g.157928 Transcript_66043/m.157928 type:complete len:438 (+) Transcript_66043:115-1428(+)|eukprot:CAMPEP_0178438736 /NCGR_PEP_ID=MMETSP0689_2-20121128/35758_1 /TAXON_ID=160604 /ORGANISM="Amphidinium massartii, Strain CS-259" /LENGTH=437 /DNA_ID=CAMNT_0020061171 /DNA_START=44 /DNA_END=1357 /DNA_ORIENTATION=+